MLFWLRFGRLIASWAASYFRICGDHGRLWVFRFYRLVYLVVVLFGVLIRGVGLLALLCSFRFLLVWVAVLICFVLLTL